MKRWTILIVPEASDREFSAQLDGPPRSIYKTWSPPVWRPKAFRFGTEGEC